MIRALFDFHGGVKPDYRKGESMLRPIGTVPIPAQLVIPLHQSIGGTPRPVVAVGERVLKGQRIGEADGNVSAAVHAASSGTVEAIEPRLMPHTSGLSAQCVVIATDGKDEWIARKRFDLDTATAEQTRAYLRDMGVVGLGGAVFPTHAKPNPGRRGQLDTLVLNGAECEPFITCDDALMRERSADILSGARIMQRLLAAQRVVVGIEDNKPEAVAAMRAVSGDIEIVTVPTRYPAGGAKQLIRVLTGIEVPHGERSTDYGVQCFNVGTAFAVHEAIVLGQPLVSRIVTVAGNVETAGNFDVPLGMSMRDVVALAHPATDTDRLIMGGPMMGLRMPNDTVPVVKATNCILVGSPSLFPPPEPEMPCIRCGDCARACPADLQPFELYWFARGRLYGKAQEYHLFDCIECGCCAYVCPSRIPLVDYYRHAKSEIWSREREKAAADAARERHEFRQLRENREKEERALKLAAKTAAGREKAAAALAEATRLETLPSVTPEQEAKRALIAAALERAAQQRGQAMPISTDTLTPEQQAEIASIDARRAEIREAARPVLPDDA